MFFGRPYCKHTHINTRPSVHTLVSSHFKHSKQVASLLVRATHTHARARTDMDKHEVPEIKLNRVHLVSELFSKRGRIWPLLWRSGTARVMVTVSDKTQTPSKLQFRPQLGNGDKLLRWKARCFPPVLFPLVEHKWRCQWQNRLTEYPEFHPAESRFCMCEHRHSHRDTGKHTLASVSSVNRLACRANQIRRDS